ncbi:hypothetical protein PT974_05388 [Cladobotryum mycophilum]|uniref:Nucleoside phosphorylase domain-containing protein n=1 Tax=Cladobotryum mycophilum TaxID=491253 RepID=A0ABR0SIJ3_9HYPO
MSTSKRPLPGETSRFAEKNKVSKDKASEEENNSSGFTRNDYTVGWVCALSTELAAARAILDATHELLSTPPGDDNNYTLGSVGKHKVVIACLPKGKYGTTSAAVVATQMLESFPSVKFGFMIGIGGGIPSKTHDIRLGDVVVSTPISKFPGVVQWDLGKTTDGGNFERTGSLNNPPRILLAALATLETDHEMQGSQVSDYVEEMLERWPKMAVKYARPDAVTDVLFAFDNPHRSEILDDGGPEAQDTCQSCDITKVVKRRTRQGMEVHYGLIASGNQVIKDAVLRNKLNRELGGHVLCVEMEAAGLMDTFPCLVIRGICDYADSHKNKDWQGHAAAVAAAFAKELLSVIPAHEVEQMESIKLLGNKLTELSQDVKELHRGQEEQRRQDILEWLTPINYSATQHEYFSKRHPETGKWLLQSQQFNEFVDCDATTLFCQGHPGVGKTILTSLVVDCLQQHGRKNNGLIGLAFIYCEFIKRHYQRTIDILSNFIKQLVQYLPQIPTVIRMLYKKFKDIPASSRSNRDVPEFIKALGSLISNDLGKAFIVIDALDECGDANALLKEVIPLSSDKKVKLFATSRPNDEFAERFDRGLSMHVSANADDVQSYIQGRLPEFKVLNDKNRTWSRPCD